MDIANTTDFPHDGVIEIAPQSCRSARTACAAPATVASPPIIKTATAMTNGGAATVAKAAWSMPSDYWLIGIIIVLVTVILMLIVYILKKRNEQTERHGGGHPSLSDTKSDPQMEITEAENEYHSYVDDAITQTVQRKFVPRELPTHEKPVIEDLSTANDTSPKASEDTCAAPTAGPSASVVDADIAKNPSAESISAPENVCAAQPIDPPSQCEDVQGSIVESNVTPAEETPEIRAPRKRGRGSQR